ncbi:MAG: hypothetical protein M1834_000850 [Cirrosporium novae-zelandiae]|nr:MAG: hypothetical protein M1834_000850 [Cirrosporium novae-zelandiae]
MPFVAVHLYAFGNASKAADDPDFITDNDVAILHDIVVTAAHDPGLEQGTFKALFAAYELVLERNGIDKDRDQVILRFVLQLGDKSLPGGSLYEKFEILLEEQGILLEIDPNNPPQGYTSLSYGGTQGTELEVGDQNTSVADQSHTRRSRRRNSVDPSRGRRPKLPRRRAASHSPSRTQLTLDASPIQPTSSEAPQPEKKPEEARELGHQPQGQYLQALPDRTWMKGNGNTANRFHLQRRDRSVSGTREPTIWRRSRSRDRPEVRPSSRVASTTSSSHHTADPTGLTTTASNLPWEASPRRGLAYHPSDTQIERDAEVLDDMRVAVVARNSLRAWRDKALQHRAYQQQLENTAYETDRRTLKAQSFALWRRATEVKRATEEEERRWSIMERRAERARGNIWAGKALTHWQRIAAARISETHLARRHILRHKYFTAWRDITAINDLKAKRHQEQCHFSRWRNKYLQSVNDQITAQSVYEVHLMKDGLLKWRQVHQDRRATEWRDVRAEWRFFGIWTNKTSMNQRLCRWAEDYHNRSVKQHVLRVLVNKARKFTVDKQQAESFTRRKAFGTLFKEWNTQARLGPIYREVSNRVAWQIIFRVTSTWLYQTRMQRQAAGVYRQRILRNALTTWNDQLRMRTLVARVDERLILQALYRWIIASRAALLKRQSERWSKRSILRKLITSSKHRRDTLNAQAEAMVTNRQQRLLRTTIDAWRSLYQTQTRYDQIARRQYSNKLGRTAFAVTQNRLLHYQQLNRWAIDARFFFSTTEFLRCLHAATEHSKRQKRRNAYSHIRRRIKTNIAMITIGTWRAKANTIITMKHQAEEFSQNHSIGSGIRCFDTWCARSTRLASLEVQSADYYMHTLQAQTLRRLTSTAQRLQQTEAQARSFVQVHTLFSASTAMRKLSMTVFQLHTREGTAAALKDRNQKKHFRSLLRYWSERTRQRRSPSIVASHRGYGDNRDDDDGNDNEGKDDWPDIFSDIPPAGHVPSITGAENIIDEREPFRLSTTLRSATLQPPGSTITGRTFGRTITASKTPVPGYLNTPSKRTARARALERLTTTPASSRTPLGTPFGLPTTGGKQRRGLMTEPKDGPGGAGSAWTYGNLRFGNSVGGVERFGRSIGGLNGIGGRGEERGNKERIERGGTMFEGIEEQEGE